MSIINLTNKQMKILEENCKKMGVDPMFPSNCKFGEGLHELLYICSYFADDVDALSDAASDLNMNAYDRKQEETVMGIEKVVSLFEEILDDTDRLTTTLQNILASYRNLSQCADYELLCSEKELKDLIDQNFVKETSLSIGYKDGEFAIFFSKTENKKEHEPFLTKVIARGPETAYGNLNDYIGQLLGDFEVISEEDFEKYEEE